MDDQQVTLGEVYRLCIDIRAHVEKQNGRVTALEKANERLKVYGFLALLVLGVVIDWLKKKAGL